MSDFRPTMLIGAGGTGCQIAEQVYASALKTDVGHQGKLTVVAFDTDENDMKLLRSVERSNRFRYSTGETIQQVIDRNLEDIGHWFVDPDQIPEVLKSQKLIDGAKQIRLLTHLALYTTLKSDDALHRLSNAFSALSRIDHTDKSEVVNVMIVGSLAGATGSGSFIQLAMLARKAAELRRVSVEVRGLFLLPDIYANTELQSGQIPNVRANAYAALKELNAAVKIAAGHDDAKGFSFEYAPGLHVEKRRFPFESTTLIDYETSEGRTLGRDLERYKSMAARAVYQLLFTPIGGRVNSESTNDALRQLAAAAAGDDNRYAATGLGRIAFPHDDIADHLTAQFALESLKGDWLLLDRQFAEASRTYAEMRREGATTQRPPDRGELYLEDLEQLATKDRNAFFREIWENLNPEMEDDRGVRAVKPRHETYLDALESAIVDRFWSSPALRDAAKRANIDATQIADPAGSSSIVRDMERALDDDYGVIEDQARGRPSDLLVNLLSQADNKSENEWTAEHLQTYVIRGGPHLVEIRAFLFALKKTLLERKAKLNPDESRRRLFRLSNQFREEAEKDPTSRGAPGVIDLAAKASRAGFLGKLRGKQGLSDFAEEYAAYYNASRRRLMDLGRERVLAQIYSDLEKEVDLFEGVVGGLAVEVDAMTERLAADVRDGEMRHSRREAGDATLWVCADSVCKAHFWDELQRRSGDSRQDERVNRALADGVYNTYRDIRREKRKPDFERIRTLFSDTVIKGHCRRVVREEHGGLLDLSVIGAVRLESEIKGEDWRTRLKDDVRIIGQQSQPFISFVDRSDAGDRATYWALHDTVEREVADEKYFDELFQQNPGEKRLARPEFSRREMLCVNSRVNLQLDHIAKLSPGGDAFGGAAPGGYFSAYQERVEQLMADALDGRRPTSMTPHIHRDWHMPGAMPEIHGSLAAEHRNRVYRAFVAAYATGALSVVERYGARSWVFKTLGLVSSGGIDQKLVDGDDFHEAVRAFETRADLADAMETCWREVIARPLNGADRATSFAEAPMVRKLSDPALLRRLLEISATRSNDNERDQRVRRLVSAWASRLYDLVAAYRTDLEMVGQLQAVGEILEARRVDGLEAMREAVRNETFEAIEAAYSRGLEDYRETVRR